MSEILKLDRRLLMQRALLLLGASAAQIPSVALAKPAKETRPYLDAPVFSVLSAVADTLVPRTDTPGAVDVRVPALFDSLLVNWASGERRHELTQALVKVDRIAVSTEGKGFAALPPEGRERILKAHELTALKVVPPAAGTGVKSLLSGPDYADPGYGKLKELVVLLYYLSEPALTQELSYVHAPGEWKPSVPVTPATRPAAGGLF